MLHRSLVGDLEAFVEKYGFDVLVILANYLSDEKQTKRQIAVYSKNLELSNQVSTWKKNQITSFLKKCLFKVVYT